MKKQPHLWNSVFNLNFQTLPRLQRYGRCYTEYLLGFHKTDFINCLRKHLKEFIAEEFIECVELLAERDLQFKLEQQSLNAYERDMFSERNKHIHNEKCWYIHSYLLAKDDLSTFFHYLRACLRQPLRYQHQYASNTISKETSRMLALTMAVDLARKYFKKTGDRTSVIQ